MKTITNEMATNLTLDISSAQSSLKELTRDVNTTTREWKAVEREMSAAGDTAGAVGARLQGLNNSIESQKNKITGLKTAIANTNTDTKKGAELYNYLQGQLESAERKLGSFNGQQQRAQEINKYYQSGLAEINQSLQKNNDISTIRVQRLQSEGREQEAVRVHIESLKNAQVSYNDILKIQQKELIETAVANGKNSDEYHKASMRVEETRMNLAKTNSELQRYQSGIKGGENAIKSLNTDLARNNDLYKSNVERLQSEGREQEASKVKLAGLHQAYDTQNRSINEQRQQLERLKSSQKATNAEYQDQRIELAKSEASAANYRKEIYATQKQVDRLNPYGFSKLGEGMNGLYKTSGKVTDGMSRGFQTVKNNAVSASVGIGLVGAASIKGAQMASELENQYKTTFNLLITGGEQASEAQKNVNKMQADGKKLSVEYGVSQSKIGDAYQELVKRGYSSEQALGSMKSMLQASVASGDDFTDVVHNSTAALESFGLKTDSVSGMTKNTKKTVNEMAFAADATATDFKSMGTAMEYVGATAHQSGLDMSETASAIGVLSNNGLEADKAGTGLRKVISSLQSPTIAASEALQGIGLSTKDFVDKSGKMKSMTDIFGMLNEHTQGMSQFKQGQLFHTLFGATGQQAGAILSENADALGKLNNRVKESSDGQGYVAKLSEKNMQSVKNELKQFQMAGEAAMMMIGKEMLPVLSEAATSMAKAFDSKEGQRGLETLAKGVGTLFGAITDGVKFLGTHTTEVKVFAAALGTIWAVKKVGDFIGMVKSAKTALMELQAVNTFMTNGASIGPLSKASKLPKAASAVTSVSTASEVATAGEGLASESLPLSRLERTAVPTLGKTLMKTASAGVMGGVLNGLSEAGSNKPMAEKVGGTMGGFVGSAAGFALGGPLGAIIGGTVGPKAGELLGDAIQKVLNGKPVKPKITFATQNSDMRKLDKSYQSFISQLNTSIVMSPKLDNSGVEKDKKSVEKAYKEMGKAVDQYYAKKQKDSKKDLDVLVKNGLLSQKQEDDLLKKSETNNKKAKKSKKDNLDKMQKDSSDYYKKLKTINDGGNSTLQALEAKYGKKSKKYRDEQAKERESANKKYQKQMVSDEAKFGNDMSKTTRAASVKQQDILNDLKSKKGKISKQEMHEAISNSTTQKNAQIKDANETYKKVVKSATQKRDETIKAADKEYYENGTISKKQHDDLVKQANGTYDETVKSAKKQKKETVDHATEQHQKIVDQAIKQAGEHKGAVDEETGNVIGGWNTFSAGLSNIWNGIASGLNGILKAIGGKSWAKIPEWHPDNYASRENAGKKHARGHQGLPTDEFALVGEEGFELAHHPQQGFFTLGANGPEMRSLSAGTSILPHDRSKQFLAMTSGLPAHKDGVEGFISDAFEKVKDIAEDTTSVLTDGPGKLIEKVSDKLGFKPFIDNFNDAGTAFKDSGSGAGELIKKNFIEAFTDLFKQKQEAEVSSKDIGAGGDWKDQIIKAAKEAHVDLGSGDLQAIMARINKESGGKQNIKQQIVDVNSINGYPAQGLLQYIPPTFKSWAVAGHGNILSGYDQLMAMFNDSNWASDIRMPGGWGPTGHRRLENGGLTTKHQMVEISENNQPEMTIPISAMKSSRGYELLGKTMAMFAARDGLNGGESSSKQETSDLSDKFDTIISLMANIVRNTGTNGSVYLDRNALSQRQESDRNLSSLQKLGGVNNR